MNTKKADTSAFYFFNILGFFLFFYTFSPISNKVVIINPPIIAVVIIYTTLFLIFYLYHVLNSPKCHALFLAIFIALTTR